MSLRDVGILFALHQYRYLNREHLERLFFSGRRRAQLKLRALQDQGLVAGWRSFSQPGLYPLPSVYVLAAAGARLLARVSESDPRRLIDQARHARSRTFHIQHDLEANGFFVNLASAARDLPDQGLYHWAGEARCRIVAAQERMATSDGWGRYLMPDREILFDLEWDRGTENDRRLAKKAKAHVAYFRGRRGASRRHVLFVAPTERREIELIRVLTGALPITGECCSFATTAASLLEYAGALGRVWHRIGSKEVGRIAFNELPGVERSDRPVEDCIGKRGWWERRRRGGEGA